MYVGWRPIIQHHYLLHKLRPLICKTMPDNSFTLSFEKQAKKDFWALVNLCLLLLSIAQNELLWRQRKKIRVTRAFTTNW